MTAPHYKSLTTAAAAAAATKYGAEVDDENLYGAAYCQWSASAAATYADNTAIGDAWLALTPAASSLKGTATALGEWSTLYGSVQAWRATEPGFYVLYSRVVMTLSADPADGSIAWLRPMLSAVNDYWWGADIEYRAQHGRNAVWAGSLSMPISQGMIDAGYGGVDIAKPGYVAAGAERANSLDLFLSVERYSPGATSDYLSAM